MYIKTSLMNLMEFLFINMILIITKYGRKYLFCRMEMGIFWRGNWIACCSNVVCLSEACGRVRVFYYRTGCINRYLTYDICPFRDVACGRGMIEALEAADQQPAPSRSCCCLCLPIRRRRRSPAPAQPPQAPLATVSGSTGPMVQMFYYENRGKCCKKLLRHNGYPSKVIIHPTTQKP